LKLNIGFIGTGSIALLHLLSLKKIKEENLLTKYSTNFEIKGVADINESTLNNLKKKNPYDIKYFTTDPDEIINDKDINIVYITTPTRFHEEYYIKCAEAGKNIFCEKPLAFTLKEIKNMISTEKKQGILTQVGLVLRHCPIFWKMKQILTMYKEALGENLSFMFRDTQEWPIGTKIHPSEWRKDPSLARAGCLYEHSIHDVDIIEYLFGQDSKLSQLFAKVRHVSPITENRLEDVANVKFEYDNGLIGDLLSIWNKARIDERLIEIFTENGYIVLDGYSVMFFKKFEYLIKRKRIKLDFNQVVNEYLQEKGLHSFNTGTGAYLFENLNFLESIIKEEKPYPGLEIGYRAHKIIELAYKSSKENQIIALD